MFMLPPKRLFSMLLAAPFILVQRNLKPPSTLAQWERQKVAVQAARTLAEITRSKPL